MTLNYISNPEVQPAISELERLNSPKDTAVHRSGRLMRPSKRLDFETVTSKETLTIYMFAFVIVICLFLVCF